jgi:hypothetical protein
MPVFDLRIGLSFLRSRLQDEFSEVEFQVICRDYLESVVELRAPDLAVNPEPTEETLFLNGRLLCLDDELKTLIDKIPPGNIAVKGGYVVAAHLSAEASAAFSGYIRERISSRAIDRLSEELRSLGGGTGRSKKTPKKKKKLIDADADAGTYEDEHALGQDAVAEILPIALSDLISKFKLKQVDVPEARLLSSSLMIWTSG